MANIVNTNTLSSSICWLAIGLIIGLSLIGLISIVKIFDSEDTLPSVTLYSMVSLPFISWLGIYEPDNPFISNWPNCGAFNTKILKSSKSLSTSLTEKSNIIDESSSNSIFKSDAIGASLTATTYILKFCWTVNSESLTLTSITTFPNQSVSGWKLICPFSKVNNPLPEINWKSYTKSSPSISDAVISIKANSSSLISWSEINCNSGSSLIGLTSNVNVWVSASCVSVTETVTLIIPYQSWSGCIESKLFWTEKDALPSISAPK